MLLVVGGLGLGAKVALAACAASETSCTASDGTDLGCFDATLNPDWCKTEAAAHSAAVAAAAAAAPVTPTTSFTSHPLSNPLGSSDFRVVIGYIIRAMLGLSGALALFVFVWSGVMMMIAAGSPEKIKKAKESLTWATIGLVVIFTAYTLVYTLITALSTGTAA